MGRPMAETLARRGWSVTGMDKRPERVRDVAGIQACETASEVASRADVILVAVRDLSEVEEVLEPVPWPAPPPVVLVTSTVPPAGMRRLVQHLASRGVVVLDCPVSGGPRAAAAGQLTVLVGTYDAEALARAEPVLSALARRVFRIPGPPGSAMAVKAVNQLLAGVHIAAAAEAVALGRALGLDPDLLYAVITESAGNSWMFSDRVPRMLHGPLTPPRSALSIFVKDLSIVLGEAAAQSLPLPLAQAAHELFLRASRMGLGELDDSSVLAAVAGTEALPASDRPADPAG